MIARRLASVRAILPALVLLAVVSGASAERASAAAGPALELRSLANTTAAPGSRHEYVVSLLNPGQVETTPGEAIVVRAQLPEGITADEVSLFYTGEGGPWACDDGAGNAVGSPGSDLQTIACRGEGNQVLAAKNDGFVSTFQFWVDVDSAAAGERTVTFEAYGGGASLPGGGACASAAVPPPALPSCATAADVTTVAPSPPPFGVDAFDGQLAADEDGAPFTQAGGTPAAASTSFDITTHTDEAFEAVYPVPGGGVSMPIESLKDVLVELPPGLVGNPTGLGECTVDQLATPDAVTPPECPIKSQIGTVLLKFTVGGTKAGSSVPLFNMVPPAGRPAGFGFNAAGTMVLLEARVRSGGDYGIVIDSRNISQALPVAGATVTLWGVPADPSHDRLRSCPDDPAAGRGCASPAPPTAFLRLPTSCSGPQTTTLHADSWAHPGSQDAEGNAILSDPDWKVASFVSHDPPAYPSPSSDWGSPQGATGCNKVPFSPRISVQPTSHAAGSPTGLDVSLSMPQTSDPGVIGTADLKKVVVDLPAGMRVNPAAANGLGACTSAQANLDSAGPAACPDNAKVGSLQIDTPLLPDPLTGSVYLAKQGDNPFGTLLGIYAVASGNGVDVKLPGRIDADPNDGRLRVTFDDNPQLPFSELKMRMFGGERATLTTPSTCGTTAVDATLASWAQPNNPVRRSSSFTISSGPDGSPCPSDSAHRPFSPTLAAGTADASAGQYSPFHLRLQRGGGEQEIQGLRATLPPGLLGKLAGVTYCPEAALAGISGGLGTGAGQEASPACPASSRVGTVAVGAGAGSDPFYTSSGRAYLAGPYKGAPLSLAVVAPAVAGPFDLGSVLVRNAIHVDPTSARLSVQSDPLPTILHGIPLNVRDLRVNVDRSQFTLNPTSCEPSKLTSTITSTEGATASPSSHFQAAGCDKLGFEPRVSLRLSGPTHRSAHPRLRAVVRGRPGDANIAGASVLLPGTEQLENAHIRTVCTRVQFAAAGGGGKGCPAGSIYGYARAWTPLLDKPLEGPVYLRSNGGERELPDLVAALDGQIHIDLVGYIDSVRERIRNRFVTPPDAPVSKFELTMQGGKKGLLANNVELCRAKPRITALFEGHNGRTERVRPLVKTNCASAKRSPGKRPAPGR